MNEISMIWVTAAVGLGSSLITLICTKIIDICQEKKKELYIRHSITMSY